MAVRPLFRTLKLRLQFSLQYSDRYDTVISADESGFVEYWKPVEPFGMPKNVAGLWSFKTETDLYEFKKVRIK
jgi:peptidylprolyl isomerase domain and WD repeat-containing protein 1